MSKKNFTGGLNSLLGENSQTNNKSPEQRKKEGEDEKKKVGRPVTQFKEITKSSQEGTKENETRATFIVGEELLDKLKAMAYWDRLLIKEVINSALQEAVDKHEKKHGSIKPIPKK